MNEPLRTNYQLRYLIVHDYTGEVNGFQGIGSLGAPSPILPIKEYTFANRLDECSPHEGPVSGTRKLRRLEVPSEHFSNIKPKGEMFG